MLEGLRDSWGSFKKRPQVERPVGLVVAPLKRPHVDRIAGPVVEPQQRLHIERIAALVVELQKGPALHGLRYSWSSCENRVQVEQIAGLVVAFRGSMLNGLRDLWFSFEKRPHVERTARVVAELQEQAPCRMARGTRGSKGSLLRNAWERASRELCRDPRVGLFSF